MPCGYLEPENVTTPEHAWSKKRQCPFIFENASSSTAASSSCSAASTVLGSDAKGGDLTAQVHLPCCGAALRAHAAASKAPSSLPAPPPSPPEVAHAPSSVSPFCVQPAPRPDPAACVPMCCELAGCVAYVFVPHAPSPFMHCTRGQACCYLKKEGAMPHESSIAGIVFGRVAGHGGGGGALVPPPLGIRSAVPLGGIGAGSMELRGMHASMCAPCRAVVHPAPGAPALCLALHPDLPSLPLLTTLACPSSLPLLTAGDGTLQQVSSSVPRLGGKGEVARIAARCLLPTVAAPAAPVSQVPLAFPPPGYWPPQPRQLTGCRFTCYPTALRYAAHHLEQLPSRPVCLAQRSAAYHAIVRLACRCCCGPHARGRVLWA